MIGSQADLPRLKEPECCAPDGTVTQVYTVTKSPHFAGDSGRRSLAVTVGDGVASVDLAGTGRSVLRPDVDFRRTIGWFSTIYPIKLPCIGDQGASATQLLAEVSHALKAVPHHGIGYGLILSCTKSMALQKTSRSTLRRWSRRCLHEYLLGRRCKTPQDLCVQH
jgi:hypothetical protein